MARRALPSCPVAWRRRDVLRRLVQLGVGGMTLVAGPAALPRSDMAPPPELLRELPDARLRGAAVMRFLGLRVYDLRLWAAGPLQDDGSGQALALELQYARALSGQRMAERSLAEMRRLAPVSDDVAARWLAAMAGFFPDVQAGDRLTGVQLPGRAARFFFNGQPRGELADAEFTRLFFGIWLSPATSEPALRQQLLAPGRAVLS